MTNSLKIYLDAREDKLVKILKAKKELIGTLEIVNLDIGDIKLTNGDYEFIIERKEANDMVSSVKDGRYKEQKMRMLSYVNKNPNARIIYILEGFTLSTYNRGEEKTLNGSLISTILRDNIPVFRTTDIKDTAIYILRLLSRLLKNPHEFFNRSIDLKESPSRNESSPMIINKIGSESNNNGESNTQETTSGSENNKQINLDYLNNVKLRKKDNITPQNWFCLSLANIPGVSIKISNTVINKYDKLETLINQYKKLETEKEKEKLLADLKIIDGNRKIGNVISARIYQYVINN
jgi:ERCC4-type nuclease